MRYLVLLIFVTWSSAAFSGAQSPTWSGGDLFKNLAAQNAQNSVFLAVTERRHDLAEKGFQCDAGDYAIGLDVSGQVPQPLTDRIYAPNGSTTLPSTGLLAFIYQCRKTLRVVDSRTQPPTTLDGVYEIYVLASFQQTNDPASIKLTATQSFERYSEGTSGPQGVSGTGVR